MLKVLSQELKTVDHILEKDYAIISNLGITLFQTNEKEILPAFVLSRYKGGINSSYLAAACQCFYLFFRFHSLDNQETRKNILLGDYFFSRFMELLILSGNISLLDHFSGYVISKTQNDDLNKQYTLRQLLPFISFILKEAKKETKHEALIEHTVSNYAKNIIRPAGLN